VYWIRPPGLNTSGDTHETFGLEITQSRRGSREEDSKQMSGFTTIKRKEFWEFEFEKFLL
jgi:hypothetical protein